MLGTLVQRAEPVRGYVIPFLLGGAVVTLAIVGAVLTSQENITGGVNGFIEGLSGRSSGKLGNIGILAPLGFSFAAGMVSTVNPCGFAMLPAYLGLYLGSNDAQTASTGVLSRLARALIVGQTVTAGFVLLFGVTGIIIGVGAQSVRDFIPWLGLSIGFLLTFGGSWLLGGGKLYSGFAMRAAAHIGNPSQVSMKGYFLFGVSYGTASLSCTLPIFLTVVASTLAVSGVVAATAQFLLYALGMGMVIIALTVGMALFKETMVGWLRRALPYIQPASAVMMILAGAYIIFYWLTIGDLF